MSQSLHKVINRNIVWDQPGAVYGFCPKCGAPGEMRESIDGTGRDRCQNKHTYPSTLAERSKSAQSQNEKRSEGAARSAKQSKSLSGDSKKTARTRRARR